MKKILFLLIIICCAFSITYFKKEIKYLVLDTVSISKNRGILEDTVLHWCDFPNPQPPRIGGIPNGVMDITHPSIVYIKQGWQGYTHWAAATPYPQSLPETGEYYENTSIYNANYENGQAPLSFSPIENNPIIQNIINSYNSDPDIYFDVNTRTMHSFTRQCNDSLKILHQSTTNGNDWTTPKIVISICRKTEDFLSPCVFSVDSTYYLLMFVKKNKSTAEQEAIIWSCKNIEDSNFILERRVKIKGGINIWHGDIFKFKDSLYTIVCGTGDNFKYKFLGSDVSKYLFLGKLDKDLNITVSSIPLIKTNGVYRSTAFVNENNILETYVSFHYRYLKDKKAYPTGHRIAYFAYDFNELIKSSKL